MTDEKAGFFLSVERVKLSELKDEAGIEGRVKWLVIYVGWKALNHQNISSSVLYYQ